MSKSVKILLVTFVLVITALIAVKLVLRQDKWLYLRLSISNSREKMVEKQWKDLEGRWFTSDKDDSLFSSAEVDDKLWKTERFIYMGQVKGGTGPKWFRKHFTLEDTIPADTIFVRLSMFDYQASVYVNGVQLSDSGFVFNRSICYKASSRLFKTGKNTIAVKAMPNFKNTGNVSRLLDELVLQLTPAVSLAGKWKFRTGDNYAYSQISYNDSAFKNINVPKNWESQAYPDYDGMAWYRLKFVVPQKMKGQELVFFGGKIDDFNEVYINGVKLGGNVFKMFDQPKADDWDNWVLYKFSGSLLKDTNLVAVRVYDAILAGGFYQGPVGIMPLSDFYNFYK